MSKYSEMKRRPYSSYCMATLLLLLAACQSNVEPLAEDTQLYLVRGYSSEDDPCKLTGETAFTNRFLDDAADLVSCPTGHASAVDLVAQKAAVEVAQTRSYTLYRVPRR